MLDDILMETRAFQELRKKAEERGLRRAEEKKTQYEEGFEEGFKAGLREAVVVLMEARFENPGLTRLVQERIESIDNKDALRGLIVKTTMASTSADVEKLFLNGSDADK